MPPRALLPLLAVLLLGAADARADAGFGPFALTSPLAATTVSAAPSWLVPAEFAAGMAGALIGVPFTWAIGRVFSFFGLGFWMLGPHQIFSLLTPALLAAGAVLAIADLDPGWKPRMGAVLGATGLVYVAIVAGTAVWAGGFVEGLFYGPALVAGGTFFSPWQLLTSALLGLGATVAANLLADPRRGGGNIWKRPKEPDPDEDPFARARPPESPSTRLPEAPTSLAWSGKF